MQKWLSRVLYDTPLILWMFYLFITAFLGWWLYYVLWHHPIWTWGLLDWKSAWWGLVIWVGLDWLFDMRKYSRRIAEDVNETKHKVNKLQMELLTIEDRLLSMRNSLDVIERRPRS